MERAGSEPRVGYVRLRRPEDDIGNEDTGAGVVDLKVAFLRVPKAVLDVEVGGVRRQTPIDPGDLLSVLGQPESQTGPLVIHESGGERLLLEAINEGNGPVVNIVHQVSESVTVTIGLGDLHTNQPVEFTIGGTRVRLTRMVIDPSEG